MRLLIPFLRALCIALLLPATVMATAETNHVPARHDCCGDAAPTGSHHAGAATPSADPVQASGDRAEDTDDPLHFSCGLHACFWVEGPELFATRPLGLARTRYATAGATSPPAARAESLHRPPAAFS